MVAHARGDVSIYDYWWVLGEFKIKNIARVKSCGIVHRVLQAKLSNDF